jgi:tRNA 2-thiouridine synthesizing protein A
MEATNNLGVSPVASEELDCSGLLCPLPIYKASMALRGLQDGEVLKVICTDPGAVEDFPAFARQGGHELISTVHGEGVHTFLIRKGGAP